MNMRRVLLDLWIYLEFNLSGNLAQGVCGAGMALMDYITTSAVENRRNFSE
jgi:hypothetical protein